MILFVATRNLTDYVPRFFCSRTGWRLGNCFSARAVDRSRKLLFIAVLAKCDVVDVHELQHVHVFWLFELFGRLKISHVDFPSMISKAVGECFAFGEDCTCHTSSRMLAAKSFWFVLEDFSPRAGGSWRGCLGFVERVSI